MWEYKHHVPHLLKNGYTCLNGVDFIEDCKWILSCNIQIYNIYTSSWCSHNVRGIILSLETRSMGINSPPYSTFYMSQSLISTGYTKRPSWLFDLSFDQESSAGIKQWDIDLLQLSSCQGNSTSRVIIMTSAWLLWILYASILLPPENWGSSIPSYCWFPEHTFHPLLVSTVLTYHYGYVTPITYNSNIHTHKNVWMELEEFSSTE